MILLRLLYVIGILGALGFIFAWLAAYGSDSRNTNAQPDPTLWRLLGGFSWRSRDTTVSAYARQMIEHAQENDRHAARLMEGRKVEEFVTTETQTIARTEQGGPG